jgi:hypothetical protein
MMQPLPPVQPGAVLLIGANAAQRVEISVLEPDGVRVADPGDAGRLAVEVEIAAGVFAGRFPARFRAGDFVAFREALRALLAARAGEARFRTAEGQLALRLSDNGRGGIALEGAARHPAGGANMIAFAFDFDRTRLAEPMRQLDAIVARFAVPA